MNRFQALSIYAFCIILTGVILIILAYNPSRAIQYMVAVGMFVSAVFAFIMAKKSKDFQIPLKYHGIHAIGMVVYGLAILFYATDIQRFIDITTFFLIYYGYTEIIFCFQLLIMKVKVIIPIVIFRMFVGFSIALAAYLMMNTSNVHQNLALIGFGIIFIINGISLTIYKMVLKKWDNSLTNAVLTNN